MGLETVSVYCGVVQLLSGELEEDGRSTGVRRRRIRCPRRFKVYRSMGSRRRLVERREIV